MNRVRQALGTASPKLILAGAWAFVVIYAFPGQMSWDSFEYLHATRHGLYTDAHPPMVSAIWSVLELVIAGPLGMLLLQVSTVIAGLYLLLRRMTSSTRAAWITAAIVVFPPVLVPMAVIWTYSLMAGLLMIGTASLQAEDRRFRIAGLVLLSIAVAVEPVALAAAIPLIGFFCRPFKIALVACVAVAVTAFGMNALLLDRELGRNEALGAAHDIAGTLRYAGKPRSDGDLHKLLAGTGLRVERDIGTTLRKAYAPRSPFALVDKFGIQMYGDEPIPVAQVQALERARGELISAYPFAYVRHRINVMKRVLGLSGRREYSPAVLHRRVPDDAISLGVGVPIRSSGMQDAMTEVALALADHTPLFVPWIYLVMAIAVAIAARRQRETLALVLSGIALEAMLIVRAHDNAYRQSHWLVLSACAGLAFFLLRRRRE